MFSRIRTHFGTAGLVVAIVALVAALTGSALAAKKYIITSKSQIAPPVVKSLKGQKGAKGEKGDAGAQGPKGDTGATGSPGAAGKDGAVGATGAAGSDGATGPTGPTGDDGATGPTGDDGATGADGSPWVVGTAPADAVFKGTWSVPPFKSASAAESVPVPFSTGVPISLKNVSLIYLTVAQQGNASEPFGCTGTADTPTAIGSAAAPATPILCIYEKVAVNLTGPGLALAEKKVSISGGGAIGIFKATATETITSGYGSWALRAE